MMTLRKEDGTQEAQEAQERTILSCASCASCVPSPFLSVIIHLSFFPQRITGSYTAPDPKAVSDGVRNKFFTKLHCFVHGFPACQICRDRCRMHAASPVRIASGNARARKMHKLFSVE